MKRTTTPLLLVALTALTVCNSHAQETAETTTSTAENSSEIDFKDLNDQGVSADDSNPFGTAVLELGSKGPGVSALQQALNKKLNPSPGLTVNGEFGSATGAAVMRFQSHAGIAVDGVVGPQTKAALAAAKRPDVDPYFRESSGITSKTGPQVITRNIFQDSQGVFWLATWHGVMRYDGKTFTNVTNKDRLRRYRAFSLLEDHQKNIWVGTVGAGVYRYDGKTWTNFTTKDGVVDNAIVTIMQDCDKNIWIGARGVSKWDGKTFTSFTEKDGFTDSDVNSISQAPDGSLWFGTRGALFHYDGKTYLNFTEKHGLNYPGYVPTVIDRKGHLWFGGENGVYHYDGKQVRHLFKSPSYSLFEDSKGNIWFSGGALKGEQEPKPGISILNRFDPAARLENILTARKQYEIEGGRGIFGVSEDKDGNIWFGTGRGIGRINGDTVQYY